MAHVFAPMQPAKHDALTGLWIPTINLEQSRKFGELVVLLPPGANRLHTGPLVAALIEGMKDFSKDDFLIAVGDPTLIAACACIAHQKCGMLRILKWDRMSSDYISVEVKI